MEINEIKKALYREKPTARVKVVNGVLFRKGIIKYETKLANDYGVEFDVNVSDMGDADLLMEMEAHLLIRYLV